MTMDFIGEDDKAPFAGAETRDSLRRYLTDVCGVTLEGKVKRPESPYHFSISLRTRNPPTAWISIPGHPMRTSWRAYMMSRVIMNSNTMPTA